MTNFKFPLFEKKEVYEFSFFFFVQRYTDLSLSLSLSISLRRNDIFHLRSIIPTPVDQSSSTPKIPSLPPREKLSSRLLLLLFSIEHPLSPPSPSLIHRSCILSSNAVADRNCESERRAGRRWADKTVVIKERSREIFPRQRSDIYTVLPASVKTRSLLAGARESRLPSAIAMRNATSRRGMLGPLDVRG